MKKNVFLAVTLLAFITVGAFAQSESDFKVTKTGTEVTITGYTGSATVVNIPARIQNLDVTTIGKDAFKSNAKITSVTIPDSVLTIEDQAFMGCAALTSVIISERATKIGRTVFSYCPNLTSVTFKGNYLALESFNKIPGDAFSGLGDLREKYINGMWGLYTRPNGTSTTWTKQAQAAAVTAANESDFQVKKEGNAITITKYVGKGTVVNIPARIQNLPVTIIGDGAFENCTSITSVAIPNGVISIWDGAFYGCTNLGSVTIPNSVTAIRGYAFQNCTKLTSITIPASVTYLSSGAFSKSGLTSITFQGQGNADDIIEGDLRKVWKGVAGTYTRPNSTSTTWTKK